MPAPVNSAGYAVHEKNYRPDLLTHAAFESKIIIKRIIRGWTTTARSGFHRSVLFLVVKKMEGGAEKMGFLAIYIEAVLNVLFRRNR
jgi:hypothetical protein